MKGGKLTFCSKTGAKLLRYPSKLLSSWGIGKRGSLFWLEKVLGWSWRYEDVANI